MPSKSFFIQILFAAAVLAALSFWGWHEKQNRQQIAGHSLAQLQHGGEDVLHLDISTEMMPELPPALFEHHHLLSLTKTGMLFSAKRLDHLRRDSLLTDSEWNQVLRFKLSGISPHIARLSALQSINLSNNLLSVLPAEWCQMTALETVQLQGNRLTALPEQWGQLQQLTTLNISDNYLTTLPASMGNCRHLQQLLAADNQLNALPDAIGNCIALEQLDLRGNQLQQLPSALCRLPRLHDLSLSGNQLHSLPARLVQLSALRSLDLSDNQLTRLPDSLHYWRGLQWLNLHRNPLPAPEKERLCKALPHTKIIF